MRRLKTILSCLLLQAVIPCYDAARILGLFPHTGRSHQMVFEPLLHELALRGHNVTVVSFFPIKNPPPNYKDLSLTGLAKIGIETIELSLFENEENGFMNEIHKAFTFGPLADMAIEVCEKLVEWPELREVFHKDDYDVILVENFNSDCFVGLARAYGITAPIVALLSCPLMPWSYDRLGIPDNPAYVPSLSTKFTNEMTFYERLENTLVHYYLKYWFRNMIQVKEQKIVEKHVGRKLPDFDLLTKNVSVMMINTHHSLHGGRPMVPGLIEVGGMHVPRTTNRIPKHIEKFINESTHGVILFSLGSLIKTSTMPKYKEEIIVQALSRFPQRIIWKHEASEENGTLTGNILRIKWLPQRDLLRHPNVVAFIAHGGLLGMTEAVDAGVPMLVMPFFGDQSGNGATAERAGFGKVLEYSQITEEKLYSALKEVLDPIKRENAKRLSKIWHDRPMSPLDTAVYWVERTARLGHIPNTGTPAGRMPLYQLCLLDVAGAIALVVISVLLVVFSLLKLLFSSSSNKKSKDKEH